jgi:hypothetical protein
MPDVARSNDLRSVFLRLFGADRGLLRSARYAVEPEPGRTEVVRSNIEARPHIDDDEFMPANVQILCCVRPSRRGGESTYVDSWSMLRRIEREDGALFRALFEVPRVFRYVDMNPVRPTFSVRYGNLICSHTPGAMAHDEIDQRVAAWVDRSPTYEFRAEAGDICVINHQRMMHGRYPFRGPRQFVRLLYWFSNGLPSQPAYLARARRFARKLARHNTDGPSWAREWMQPSERSINGLSRVAAVMACLGGQDEAELAHRLGISELDLTRWTSRVLCVAAAALSEPDAELAASRATIQRQVLSVVDGLLGEDRPRSGSSRARRARRR